jgi:hypothetical protein
MKKIFLVLVLLASINSVSAFTERAKVKVGNVNANVVKGKSNHNFIVSKSGNNFNVALGMSNLVISRNPRSTILMSSLAFVIEDIEGDLQAKKTYNLVPPPNHLTDDGYNMNAIVNAGKTVGSKGWTVSTLGEEVATSARAFGKLRVVSYNPTTGQLRAVLNASFSPSVFGKLNKAKYNEKKVPYRATIQAVLQ